jgi:hypothetical protein
MATKKKMKKTAKKKPTARAKSPKPSGAKNKPKKNARSMAKRAAKKAQKKAPKNAAAPKKSREKLTARKTPYRRNRGQAARGELASYERARGGPDTGGQSGDTQGLSGMAETDSESVKELLEEGQAYEAEVVGGVESVPDADQGEVRMREVPEDDVPEEYLGEDAQK